MEGKGYWIWLSKVDGLGPRRIKKLLDYFGDAQGIWQADKEIFDNISGIGKVVSQKIIDSKKNFDFKFELERLNKFGIKVVTLQDTCYPRLLKEIYDPPPILYYKGSIERINKPCIAVVGSRKCTQYGKRIASKLSQRLAEKGLNIVSGLAYGIDTSAHQGALKSGITYAILGSGVDVIYPKKNKGLAKKIEAQGAVISSFPLATEPGGKNFPVRNRIISGLCLGTIVVEATKKSGSLITANLALNQGREVFAIPGDITRKQSVGTNQLIQVGAKLVQDLDDILEELNLLEVDNRDDESNLEYKSNPKINETLNEQEQIVYKTLTVNSQQFEYLLDAVELTSAQLNSVLLELEVKGIIEQLPGRKFRLRDDVKL
ncbi:DNA-processing protein DprA [Natroniella sulfidigena]|uniref:DNA-processing protein DprA n=1 Tax=Natroniella sulfidigena TaxID=723921 RepID=UPI00200A5910|nr:DNA-processing protein DprA [Natroniella sulfidigena]MCK8816543.1 DNA-processing protein DprA [Natroniella sulfidigena]